MRGHTTPGAVRVALEVAARSCAAVTWRWAVGSRGRHAQIEALNGVEIRSPGLPPPFPLRGATGRIREKRPRRRSRGVTGCEARHIILNSSLPTRQTIPRALSRNRISFSLDARKHHRSQRSVRSKAVRAGWPEAGSNRGRQVSEQSGNVAQKAGTITRCYKSSSATRKSMHLRSNLRIDMEGRGSCPWGHGGTVGARQPATQEGGPQGKPQQHQTTRPKQHPGHQIRRPTKSPEEEQRQAQEGASTASPVSNRRCGPRAPGWPSDTMITRTRDLVTSKWRKRMTQQSIVRLMV